MKTTDTLMLALLFLPIAAIAPILLLNSAKSKYVALTTTLVGLVLAGWLYFEFMGLGAGQAMSLKYNWFSSLFVSGNKESSIFVFALRVDSLSLALVLLTKFIMPIVVLAHWNDAKGTRGLFSLFLLMDAATIGTFLAADIILFYVFWEAMLVPMFFLIGLWGGDGRLYATLKFFLYTFAGSVLMLVSIFYIIQLHGHQFGFYTTDIAALAHLAFSKQGVFWGLNAEMLVFLGFFLSFAIKVPLFPFHTWLPDAHVQAPTGGSILLAAVLLKMGTYGLLRFCLPITPIAFVTAAPYVAWLSLIGIIYGALAAFWQTDIKKLVAYSSVSHMGFIVLGIFAMNEKSIHGALIQMINHGVSTGGLFFLVGILYYRAHSRDLNSFGGLAKSMPWYAFFLILIGCSSMGVPGLNGFVGEFLILFGSFERFPWITGLAVTGVVFGALYILKVFQKVLFGTAAKSYADLKTPETVGLVAIGIAALLLGIMPNLILKTFSEGVGDLLKNHKQNPSAIVMRLENE